jgi:hypothetical protein
VCVFVRMKAALRFQHERLARAKRRDQFNLDHEDELTHMGRSLSADAAVGEEVEDEFDTNQGKVANDSEVCI